MYKAYHFDRYYQFIIWMRPSDIVEVCLSMFLGKSCATVSCYYILQNMKQNIPPVTFLLHGYGCPFSVLLYLAYWWISLTWKVDLTAYVEKHDFCFDSVLDEYVTNDEVSHLSVCCSCVDLLVHLFFPCSFYGFCSVNCKLFISFGIFYGNIDSVILDWQVYRVTVQPIIPTIFQRTKATCFAYGQTGALTCGN